jgi:hypothetical protein
MSQGGCNAYLWQKKNGNLYLIVDDVNKGEIKGQKFNEKQDLILQVGKVTYQVPGYLTMVRET